jgi:hypothetical protein
MSVHRNPARGRSEFGNDDRQDAITELGRDAVRIHGLRQRKRAREGAVATFHSVELGSLLMLHGALAAHRENLMLQFDLDLVALQAGQLDGEDEPVAGLIQVDALEWRADREAGPSVKTPRKSS